jgi:GSH-dependent disulfide-bond oxidoreductase
VVVLSRHRPWLLFGQAVHFQHAAPEKLPYAINRYRREVERHYRVLDEHMAKRDYIVGNDYSFADISAWGWLDRASRVLPGEGEPLAAFPITRRFFDAVDARPAVARASLAGHFYTFKRELDEEARRSLFPSNYDSAAC